MKTRRRQSVSVQSPLETYLREINETSLLSADDEHQLAIAIGDGDIRARDRMVRANGSRMTGVSGSAIAVSRSSTSQTAARNQWRAPMADSS